MTALYIGYKIYICPENPTNQGRYYGKTPILEQAQKVVKRAKDNGLNLFIKGVNSDKTETILL